MFIDEKSLSVQSGKGGDGAVLFRREIYVPHGGPDGGDGGRGGSVYVVGKRNLHTLSDLAHVDRIRAEDGKIGGHNRSSGKSGEDAFIYVPLGTAVYLQKEDGRTVQIGEILQDEEKLRVAKGGNGGWGNWHFRSSVQQAPDHANPGQPSEKCTITLVLKLIADIGLIGLPNAGKSTFLSVVSAAKPKIANYPFTTLEPQLGVATVKHGREQSSLVIADLPGLIEGASQGKGLGISFLKHLERTRAIIHFLDSSVDTDGIIASYRTIRNELSSWSETLAAKPEIVVLSKADLIAPEDRDSKCHEVEKALGIRPFILSAASHEGLDTVLTAANNLIV